MPPVEPDGIVPRWPVPSKVRAFQTTIATGGLDGLRSSLSLPAEPAWLVQEHGAGVARPEAGQGGLHADAAVTTEPGIVLAVRTADCLPILLSDEDGTAIAAVHAGWRGLAAGVIESAVTAMDVPPAGLVCWLGPAIGQDAFEVGPEVRGAFLRQDAENATAFVAGVGDRWHADLLALARRRLAALGVHRCHGGDWCTWSDPARFHSYRRDRETGRMATLIWMER